ncbi:dihydrodipicolinate synthase family protein [Polycladidibacter stylochi]|uniref:dihydrodipicolinate synthase family protein n=1 Tax=Polycladidibacter stylochi TaxID=1807766 RepID=UPI000830E2B4|nr:dihydrodipicolinate synthase family protein [Pseudovibrio stylochi]
MLTPNKLKGNWATLLLPLHGEDILWEILSKQIGYYIEAGVDGIYSNGTAGEFYAQSYEEFCKITEMLAMACHEAGMAFQVGASHCHPQSMLKRVAFAARTKPAAIQVILPDWFPCNLETAATFLQKAACVAEGTPLVLYNPPHAKVNLAPHELRELFDATPSLIGFKLPRLSDEICATNLQNDASIFVAGHFLATDSLKGARGSYSNVCCLNPVATQKWTDACLASKPDAIELEGRIQLFMRSYMAPFIEQKGYCNAAVDKFMASLGGWCPITPAMRFPYRSIPKEESFFLRKKLQTVLPEFC